MMTDHCDQGVRGSGHCPAFTAICCPKPVCLHMGSAGFFSRRFEGTLKMLKTLYGSLLLGLKFLINWVFIWKCRMVKMWRHTTTTSPTVREEFCGHIFLMYFFKGSAPKVISYHYMHLQERQSPLLGRKTGVFCNHFSSNVFQTKFLAVSPAMLMQA